MPDTCPHCGQPLPTVHTALPAHGNLGSRGQFPADSPVGVALGKGAAK